MQKYNLNLGKVINYEFGFGRIISGEGNTYIFTENDLLDEEVIEKGDIVYFRKEKQSAKFIKKAKTKSLTRWNYG